MMSPAYVGEAVGDNDESTAATTATTTTTTTAKCRQNKKKEKDKHRRVQWSSEKAMDASADCPLRVLMSH